MKKLGVLLIFVILVLGFFSLVLAQTPDNPTAGLEGATGGLVDQEGIHTDNVNITGYKSKAEERIDAINVWVKNNASWLVYVFGMVPEVSWLFALNVYCLLLFFVILVLNGVIIRIPVELIMALGKGTKEKEVTVSRIIGAGIFIFLLETKFFLNVIVRPAIFLWDKVLTYGWIAIVAASILLIVLLIFFPQVLTAIGKAYEKWKEKRAKKQQEKDQEKLHDDVEVAEKFTESYTEGEGI